MFSPRVLDLVEVLVKSDRCGDFVVVNKIVLFLDVWAMLETLLILLVEIYNNAKNSSQYNNILCFFFCFCYYQIIQIDE